MPKLYIKFVSIKFTKTAFGILVTHIKHCGIREDECVQYNGLEKSAITLAWSAVSLHPAHVRHSSQNQRPPLAKRAASSAPRPPPTQERCTELPHSEHELSGSARPRRFLAAVPKHSPQIGNGADCCQHRNGVTITKHVLIYPLLLQQYNIGYEVLMEGPCGDYGLLGCNAM
jgi:hypothetical protein